MLFRKNIERRCSYCIHCTKLDDEHVLCSKQGLMPTDAACKKFSYDPCKRIPGRMKSPDFAKYENEDFSL